MLIDAHNGRYMFFYWWEQYMLCYWWEQYMLCYWWEQYMLCYWWEQYMFFYWWFVFNNCKIIIRFTLRTDYLPNNWSTLLKKFETVYVVV